jgi:Phosphodiester glycosidase
VSSKLFTRLVGIGLVGLVALSSTATAWAGPVTTRVVISRKTLKPGLTLVHSRITVRGVFGAQEVYKLAWKMGNPHVGLHSSLLGPYDSSSTWITDHPISHLASSGAPAGLVAAMTGDYSIYKSWSPTRSITSGILMQNRRIFRFGTGSLAVGYKPNGRFTFGHPILRPMRLEFPGGTSATVGAFNPAPATLAGGAIRSDQVAVYTHAGQTITVPAGAIGVALSSDALATELRGSQIGFKNPKGVNKPESVVAFRITESTAERRPVSMPIAAPGSCTANVCQPAESVAVPNGGVVLLARTDTTNQVAAAGLQAQAALGTPVVNTAIDDAGWGKVSDLTGGKPMLVNAGHAISTRPDSVDSWQWDCGGGCWRPALVRSGSSAWMILIGGKSGMGLTMPKFASVLADMGATDALGFDNNNSAELWRPGHRPITGYGYERLLPTATSLSYRG